MRPNPRSRFLWFVVIIAVIAVIREISIRRHLDDVETWPEPA